MIYLDSASTTQIDPRVLDAMMPYLTDMYGNPGTLYDLGVKSAQAIQTAREQVANLIGAHPDQIIFTSGGSEANNLVFFGLRKHLKEIGKTRIVTSMIEHDSVLNAVGSLADDPAFRVAYLCPNHDGEIPVEYVRMSVESKTGLVSIMHTNNETGVSNSVQEYGKICKKYGALFHTDCVQAASSIRLNVNEIGCDFMSLSSHKLHGPKGMGALYVREKSLLSPIIFGGSHQEFGLRGGTENVAGIVGFGKACQLTANELNSRTPNKAFAMKMALYACLRAEFEKRNMLHVMHVNGNPFSGDNNGLGKVINVRFDGADGETLLLMLNSAGVCVSAGSACRSHESQPSRVLTTMGISAEDAMNSIRLSTSRMNSGDEMERAAKIIADCVDMLVSKN